MMCKCNDWGFYVDIEKNEKDTICNECKKMIYTVCKNNNKETTKETEIKNIKTNSYFINYLKLLFFLNSIKLC